MSAPTPSQTIGPFFGRGLRWAIDLTAHPGEVASVQVAGRVLDVEANGVADALLEIWQPALAHSGSRALSGFQRVATDLEGRFAFQVARPGEQTVRANVTLFARGLLRGLFTRVYLVPEGVVDAAMGGIDYVAAERRHTLLARRSASDPARYQWDIRLRGPAETVFFEF